MTDYIESEKRLRALFNEPSIDFEKKRKLPSLDRMTYTDAHYAECLVVAVDIRNSSHLHEQYPGEILTRIYRGYIAELVRLMRSNLLKHHVRIDGDSVLGIFQANNPANAEKILELATKTSIRVKLLNKVLAEKSYQGITVGIGIAKGEVLVVKAGQKNTTDNDTVWLGEPVNRAAKLSSYGHKNGAGEIMISKKFHAAISNELKGLFEYFTEHDCYTANLIHKDYEQYKELQESFAARKAAQVAKPKLASPPAPFLGAQDPNLIASLLQSPSPQPSLGTHLAQLAAALGPSTNPPSNRMAFLAGLTDKKKS